MANFIPCLCLFRIALPVLITLCIIFRPSGLSAIYLLFLLYLPFVPVPTTHTMLGCTGIYLKMLIAASTLTAVTQLAFQIVLLSLPPYGEFLTYCETLEKILRHVGLVKLDGISATSAIAWLAPEVGMFIGSIAIYVLCSKLVAGRIAEDGEQGEVVPQIRTRKRSFSLFAAVGRYLSLIALCVAAVLRPSITGGIYFLVFLSAATWWACYKELRKGFAILTRCVCALVFIHICVLYAYQFQWPQEFLEQNSTYARYFGLTPMISVNCSDPRNFIWADVEWATYLNPIALLFLYYILAIESKLLLMPQTQKKQGAFSRLDGSFNGPLTRQLSNRLSNKNLMRSGTTRHRWQSATRKVRVQKEKAIPGETSPLIRGVSPSRKYGAQSKRPANVLQDSTGSVTVTEGQDDIPMQQLGTTEEEYKPGLFENVVFALESIVQVIIRSSYIGTNIIMMAWSITYHSWITFVLLLWANILWMIPNQRRSMLYCSPLLVIYAWFLLLSAYIFSMDLTEAELPSVIDGVDFNQIGFVKITELPCVSLLVKCLYTTMFWITLRQFMKERQEARQSSTLADIVAPLQVTVGTATGVSKEQEKGSKILEIIGQVVKNFLTKFWIWAVAATLFAVAITGQRMTGFRIIYMALFLIFILSFQLSFRMWRKVMFGFWLTVIIYSMIILILVYTYQFKNFPRYWSEYLHVPKKQQEDIGLETYETKQLFIRLVTPTVFVVITVIQLHYFHKDFMEISNPKNNSIIETRSEAASSAQGAPWDPNSDKTDTTVRFDISEIGNVSSKHIQEFFRIWLIRIHKIINLIYLFLEIHMPKIVLFVAMLLCIYDKCAIYFLIILLLVLAFSFGRPVQIFAIYASSVLVSVLLLLRMIYQIEFVKHDAWNVTCYNLTNNTATWLGFNKTNGNSLPQLVRWNIIFIMVATVWSVVLVRQENYRIARGKPTTRAFFMFPKIKRADADKSVENCLKYLANFGFYKFGVEISLIATVALIGFRMDVYSVLYAIWLCILFSMDRSTLSKVWNFYLAFIAILLPIQYVMAIGLPPNICIDYPWKNDNILRRLQEWMFLMDIIYPSPVKKLLCDFILLLLVSRQSVAFRIERRNAGQDYPGGSNDTITQHAEEKDFINPVPDYVTYIRSYLDAFKRGVFLSFMWITLAIVFLAGTNRVSLFSIGYLGGSFVFLWHGSDLYLRPIPSILKLWNWLLGYNVVVIFIKTFLQFVGCVYAEQIMESTCWLVHLLAIGCVEKFEDITNKAGIVDPNKCAVPREYIGLAWDGVCFAFLILQRRIFNSYNFFHVVDETKATTILASRGAELIEELRDKRMTEQEEQERRILEKIKAKMDRIKANQQKIQGPSYKDSTNHFVGRSQAQRSPSLSSCTSATSQQTPPAGYHTPIDEDEQAPLTPHAGSSILQNQAPSPYSAIMTVSLEGYLEPQRMSFSSPPNSELNPRAPSPDDSFPVFSPPPYDAAPPYTEVVNETRIATVRQTSIGPPWMQGSLVTPRQSIISYSSRSPLSHHTYGIFRSDRPTYMKRYPTSYKSAIRSGDYYMFDELDDEELDLIEDMKAEDDDEEEEKDTTEKRPGPRRRTVGELLSSAMKTNISTAVHSPDHDVRRRASMPLSRQRSYMSARSQLSAPLSAPPTIAEHPSQERKALIDSESYDMDGEPKPGTSKDEEISELSEPRESIWQKVLNYILFVIAFINSSMVSLTNFLNKYSKDYRYVIKVLTKEKKILKEQTEYSVGVRLTGNKVWQPSGSYHALLKQSRMAIVPKSSSTGNISQDSDTKASSLTYSPEKERRKTSVLSVPEIRILAPSLERGLDFPLPGSRRESPADVSESYDEYEGAELSSVDQPTIIRLLLAIWYIILSHSDVLCYFMIFLNQIKSASFLSLPLPVMVFFWGTLTIPRPTKTFWVTIIAYTEVIVLIKCVCQIKLPWTDTDNVLNSPLYPPKIIGIERAKDYAIWDLVLLLIVFFHRFLLKCLGLWKSSYTVPAVISDGDYKIIGDELYPVAQSSQKRTTSQKHSHTKKPSLNFLSSKFAYGSSYNIEFSKDILYRKEKRKILGFLPSTHLPKPILKKNKKREILETGDSDTVQIYKGSPAGRTASDLQKLVEEPEEQDDDDDNEDKISDQENIVEVHSKEVDPCDHFRESFKITTSQYADSVKKFFRRLIDPSSRVAADVYSYMFLCDFFNFFVILIGYSSFGAQQGDGGVSSYLTDNRVPVLFLLMLILQFTLIIVDRAIFLRKYILGKIIFQFLQIFILHMWLFVLFPIMTERSFNSVIPPQMYYMVKCFYLLLSAYQIRCGYPSRILGNFLCKGYNYANYFLFKGFMAVPFLFELRTVMDWMWTDTSMTVFDWIKMEDIFSHIFQLKCTRYVESEYPQPRGEKKSPTIKYLMGGGVLAFIVAVIWFPLVFFSLGNAVGEPNIPFDVTVDVRIGPYEPIYTMSAQSNAISQFGDYQLKKLYDAYSINKPATTFISNYEAPDVAAVLLSSDSGTVWSISPPDRDRMLQEVNSTKTLTVRLQYVVSHKSNNKEDSGVIRKEIKIELDAKAPARKILLDMLLGSETAPPVPLTYIMPKFIKVTNRGTADPITILMDELNKTADSKYLRNLTLKLSQAKNSSVTAPRSWWEIHEECDDNNFKKYLVKIPYADLNCSSLIMYTFNDKIFPETLSIITAGGIIGLYTTLVFVASRVLRSFFSDICFKIMFDDMPNVDRVLQLCLDIYLVREANEFALEEDLFAKLVFLFRSPETLIKWTRPKEEIDDDDDDPEGGAQ